MVVKVTYSCVRDELENGSALLSDLPLERYTDGLQLSP